MAAERTSCAVVQRTSGLLLPIVRLYSPKDEWDCRIAPIIPPFHVMEGKWRGKWKLVARWVFQTRGRNEERREREEKTAIIPSGAISEAVETNGRYRKPIRINRDPEIWFRSNTKLFLGRWRRKRKRKKGRKGGSRRENPSSNRKFVSRFVSRREFDACRIMKRGWSGIGVEKRLKVGSRNNWNEELNYPGAR